MAAGTLAARWLLTVGEIAVRAVGPKQVVRTVQETLKQADVTLTADGYYVVGIGKAAIAQVREWMNVAPPPADHRVFAPRGYGTAQGLRCIFGDHPVPGPDSFRAGRALREWLLGLRKGVPLVAFVSGGGSAAVEDPAPGFSPADIAAATEQLLAARVSISTINAVRAQWSSIKAGRAWELAGPRRLILVVQADVPPADEAWVSSGPFDPGPFATASDAREWFGRLFPGRPFMDPSQRTASLSRDWHGLRILAGSNHLALMTAAHIARREGLSIEVLPEFLSDDAEVVGKRLAERARDSAADVILAGGEPLVELGDAPGRGGRLGVLTLAYGLAERREPAAPLLTLASDGADGASQGAGAFWLPGPFDRHLAQRALAERDSDRFFQRAGWLLKLPATGANVRDLAFVLTHPEKIAREP